MWVGHFEACTIVSVTLRLLRGSLTGTNPFTTHGTCWVDVQNGGFSGSTTLQNADFQATATAVHAASLSNAASDGTWSTGTLNAAGLAAVNKTGTTQLRVYFNLDDNDDTNSDYLGYYSGENGTAANRPCDNSACITRTGSMDIPARSATASLIIWRLSK